MATKFSLLITALILSTVSAFALPTPPVITLQPVGQTVAVGNTVILTVVATGDILQYQWTLNGDVIPGATASSLTLTNMGADSSGSYRVFVFNTAATTASGAANVLVLAPALPFADAFANRGSITGLSGLGSGSSLGATKEANDPKPGNGHVGSSVWLKWVAPTNGVATITTIGSTFDTVLGVYTGTVLTNLVKVADDDDAGDYHTSFVTFNAQAGTTYQIFVGSMDKDGDAILLGWYLHTPITPLPTITAVPTYLSKLPGASGILAVAFQSTGVVNVQWYHNGLPITGATQSTLQFTALTVADLGTYQVILSTPDWTWAQEPVEIEFNSEGLSTVAARNKLFDSANAALVGHN